MHIHSPSLVLIPDTFLSASDAALALLVNDLFLSTSLLVEYTSKEFPGVQIDAVRADIGTSYDTGGKLSWTFSFRFSERFVGLDSSPTSASMMTSERGWSSLYLISEPFLHFMFCLFEYFFKVLCPLRLLRCSSTLRPTSMYGLLDHYEFNMFQ
jgi:hypothetical protein